VQTLGDKSDQEAIEEFKSTGEKALALQKRIFEENMKNEKPSTDVSFADLSYFKQHSNTDQDNSTQKFLQIVSEGKEKVKEDRAKAQAAVEELLAAKRRREEKCEVSLTDAS